MVGLKNICYEKGKSKILKNINLNFQDNKINFIIGENGSGKTLLLEIISNTIKPTFGEVNIQGNNNKIAMINQNLKESFFTNSVKKELEIEILRKSKEKREMIIQEVIKLVKLSKEILTKNPLSLSNIDTIKLAIACAITRNTDIILIDSPSSLLSRNEKNELIELIKHLKYVYNKTIIIASNDIEFTLLLADYIYVLYKGEVVLKGCKYDILKQEEKLLTYNIKSPKIIHFINLARNNKNKKLIYRDNVNDLIKDIYRLSE